MTYLDDVDAGMTSVHARAGGVVTLLIDNVGAFATRCPEQYAALVDYSSFVNGRRVEKGELSVLALAFDK